MKQFIYGINSVESAIETKQKIICVYINLNAKNTLNIQQKLREKKIEIFDISELKNFNVKKSKTQGIVALIEQKPFISLEQFLGKIKEKENILILDSITDPHNFGAIIRSAVAFNIKYIVIKSKNSSPVNPVVVNSSAGCIFHSEIILVSSLNKTVMKLKDNGYWIYGADMNGEYNYQDIKNLPNPKAIIIGSEGKGISPVLSKKIDFSISIKINNKVESLNASVAASIILSRL